MVPIRRRTLTQRCLGFLLGLSFLPWTASATDLATALAYDDHISNLVQKGQDEMADLWSEAGSLGGFEEWFIQSVQAPIDLKALGAAYREEMDRMPAAARATSSSWLEGPLGNKVSFLLAYLESPEGQGELRRNGRHAWEQATEERRELLTRVDEATGAREVTAYEASAWLRLLNSGASQVPPREEEDDDWLTDLDRVNDRWAQGYHKQRWPILAYLYARLDDRELSSFLDFAESEAGRALFAARSAASRRVVDLMAEGFEVELRKLLAEGIAEIWDGEREEDEREEEEGDDS